MGRRRKAAVRIVAPDPVHNDVMISKFINKVMLGGKKSIAEKIVYTALETAGKKLDKPPKEVFHQVMSNVKPLVEVRSRRVGGATYQVPVEVRPVRQISLGMRWMVRATRDRAEKTMIDKLSNELMDAYNNTGKTIKKREETHKMAEANRAFAHFKW
ncbi:MAG: 30S ribosomal protein S7 [bacterium]|nr:MAG: 30S ribosomal protein S7 [bacterium]